MGARIPAGRLRVVHNWSWDPVQVTVPGAVTDLLSGQALDAGEVAAFAPWDVRVFVERTHGSATADRTQEVTP